MITWPVFASIAITDQVANAGAAAPSNERNAESVSESESCALFDPSP